MGFLLPVVLFIYISKGTLLITRYSHPSKMCPNNTHVEPEEGDDSAVIEAADREYYFTVVVYAICSTLRCIEYIPLLTGLYKFLKGFKKERIPRLQHSYRVVWFLLAPVLLLALSVPAIGVVLELDYEEQKRCNSSMAKIFVVYCIINFFRYTWAFLIRVAMVAATLFVREIWAATYNMENFMDITPEQRRATRVHARLTAEYTKRGKMVQAIASIFQTWFLFPWIIFFMASSLEAKKILQIWSREEEEIAPLPLVYFLLYNISQVIFLLIPYLCGQKMDHYHHNSHIQMRELQLNPEMGEKYIAHQRTMLIKEDEDYNFVPRAWGIGIKVKMNSLIYVIFLILGLLFTLWGTLL